MVSKEDFGCMFLILLVLFGVGCLMAIDKFNSIIPGYIFTGVFLVMIGVYSHYFFRDK